MKYLIFVFVLFPFLFIVACGGDDRADTIELPIVTNTVDPTDLIPILEETAIITEKLTNTPTPEATPTNIPMPTDTPKSINTELTEEQILASSLTIDDMPIGSTWVRDPNARVTVIPFSLCQENFGYNLIGVGDVQFSYSDQGVPIGFMIQELVYFENNRIAEEAFADSSNSLGCIIGMDDDIMFMPLSFPKLGDDTFAARAEFSFEGQSSETDVIIFREDNIITYIHHSHLTGIDPLLTEELAIKALERIKENN